MPKYAIVRPADQTIIYYRQNNGEDDWTTKHPEAYLFDNLSKASSKAGLITAENAIWLKNGGHNGKTKFSDETIAQLSVAYVELVEDEDEFRAREDTW